MAISQQKTWVTSETITATGLNADPASLVDAVNDLAGQYRTLLNSWSVLSTGSASDTYIAGTNTNAGNPDVSGTTDLSAIGFSNVVSGTVFVYLVAADFSATDLTTKLRLRAQILCNATAPAVTFTMGLYPATFAGGANAVVATLGTVVSGSTVAIASPTNAGNPNEDDSGDFTFPSDGVYAAGFTVSGALASDSDVLVMTQLQMRSV